MKDIKEIDQLIADKKATLAVIVNQYNQGQEQINKMSIEIIKLQGNIEALESIKVDTEVKK
jgi:hypothetical protein